MKVRIKPTIKQDKALEFLQDDITRFLMFGGGAGGGKTWLGNQWLVPCCYFFPGTKWFIGRKELKSIKRSNLPTFQKFCRKHKIPKTDWDYNAQENYLKFFNGSKIDFLKLKFQPSNPDYGWLGSTEYTGGWLEEASEIHFKAFDILKTRVGRWRNKEYDLFPAKILITCNPSKNWLYRLIYRPWRDKILPEEYAFIQSLFGDNPHTKEQYGRQLSEIRDKATKQRLKFGNWEYAEHEDALIEYDAILDLFTNVVEKSGEKYLTGDIARLGQDKTVIAYWEGWEVKEIWIWRKQRLNITENKISEIITERRIPRSHVVNDEGGVGGGIVDGLSGTKGFVANSSALEDPKTKRKGNYRRLKDQCAYLFADKVNDHEIAISAELSEKHKDQIIEELEQIRAREVHKDKPKEILPKDEVVELIGRSPDFLDCLIQRIYFELKRPQRKVITPSYVPSHYKRG